jgi:hypothetical protein
MKNKTIITFLFTIFIFICSCENDLIKNSMFLNLKSLKIENGISNSKSWFENNSELNNFQILSYIDGIKWENACVSEINDSIITEVQLKIKNKFDVKVENNNQLNVEYRLLLVESNNKISSYIEYFISEEKIDFLKDTEKVNFSKKDENFDGIIILENNIGEIKIIYHSEVNEDCQEMRLKSVSPQCTCYGMYEFWDDGSSSLLYVIGCYCGDGGGGIYPGSGGTINPRPLTSKPCPGDPINNPRIASSGNSGTYGGMFGCTRQGGIDCNNGIYNVYHGGMDIYSPVNSPLYAISSGKVTYKGYLGSLGLCVQITSDDGKLSVTYGHLNSCNLAVGRLVNIGDQLGLTGKTGNANSPEIIPHVHIQIKNNGLPTDPQSFLKSKFNADGTISKACINLY